MGEWVVGAPPVVVGGVTRLRVGSAAESVKVAREWVGDWLYDHGYAEASLFPAQVVVSELVTNAYRHAHVPGRPITVALYRSEGGVVCVVGDASEKEPEPQEFSLRATSGRGLSMIGFLVRSWGWHHPVAGGKGVWAVLDAEVDPSALDDVDG
ncbi:ATP-binding protein [Actinomadura parmotrematis]|uniref:ATP-binding protein n=1 Tax=Actinomadura parmotrematis TaxID=2864039 RepID=A0ABS7FTY4_9ACTN|nr:ATP-binding protein [Actinomadura parmotrematis]MBW8483761.1 ATP-binding protein [Actinomadura parmotrematis]